MVPVIFLGRLRVRSINRGPFALAKRLVKKLSIKEVIGRLDEIAQIKKVLIRKNKANVLLVGDAGVGKTALAQGLALNFIEDYTFKRYSMFSLRFTKLLAGTAHRGEFEDKFESISLSNDPPISIS